MFINTIASIKPGIYAIKNLDNNKIYVEKAKNLNFRIKSHLKNLCNGTHHNIDLQDDYNNQHKFEFIVLEEFNVDCKDDTLRNREFIYMGIYQSFNKSFGYNSPRTCPNISTEDAKEILNKRKKGEKNEQDKNRKKDNSSKIFFLLDKIENDILQVRQLLSEV